MGKDLDIYDVVHWHPKAAAELKALESRIAELEALLELHKCPECHLANDHKMACSFRNNPGAVNFLLRKRVAELESASGVTDADRF